MVDGKLTTSSAETFPPSNLPASAQQWSRAVMQRVAQLEDAHAGTASKAVEQNRTSIQTLRRAAKGALPNDATVGQIPVFNGDVWMAQDPEAGTVPPDASVTTKGIVELASNAEAVAGTDSSTAVTPESLHAALAGYSPGGGSNLADAWRGEWVAQ